MATWQIQEWSPGRCGGPEHRRRVTSRRGATPYLPSTPRPALIAGRASHRIGRGLRVAPRDTAGHHEAVRGVTTREELGEGILRWACLDSNQGPLPYQRSALTG